MFLLCCIRICKAKTLLLYFVLHSKDSLIVVVFVLHVETFSGLKWDFNSLHEHDVFGSGCLRQSLPGLNGLKVSQPSVYRLFLFSSECVCVSSVRLSR